MAKSERDGIVQSMDAARRQKPLRGRLLSGVSLLTLLGSSAVTPNAQAGQPPLLSPQWLAQRSQAMRGGGNPVAGALTTTGIGASASVQTKMAQSMADLNKMAAAIRQAQSIQTAAAALAAASSPASPVPNGLAPGGLQVAPAVTAGSTLWIGANLPTQTATGDHTSVTITQTQQQAMLTWQTFNVGAKTSLTFDQTSNGGANASNWVALNRVVDPSAQPSRILGSISAPGKVFIINQSGIIFGAGAQVNANALIASAADLRASVTVPGGTAAPSVDFSLYGAQSGSSFAPTFLSAPSTSTIDVEPGAQITTSPPASAASGGGYVMLLGGEVRNGGAISTPFGQTVLAAGQDFILRPGYSTTGNQTATTRGSQVATLGTFGSLENDGIITATDGDITFVGHNITQAGVALASTSVNVRGSVHLLTNTLDKTATITLAPGSITAVQPDNSADTALNSQRSQLIALSGSLDVLRLAGASSTNPQLNNVGTLSDRLDQSRIEITTGGSVEFGAGSLTMAQGGQVAVQAARRVQTDSTAAIDVSGQLGVTLPMNANDLVISVQSFEQRDAPVNRLAGSLNSSNVTIDARDLVLVPASTLYPTDRYYTPGGLLEVSGYLNTTGHTIGEWTATGGTITLSGASVVTQTASTFNVAGGSLNYQGGTLHTTYLIGADGNLYNANTAPATIAYTGIYNGFVSDHPRWNVSQVYQSSLLAPSQSYQDGYIVGRDAGSLVISAPTVIFEGSISAGVVNGSFQSTARPAGVTDGYTLGQNVVAMPGTLALGRYDASGLIGANNTSVVFEDAPPALADSLTVTSIIPVSRRNTALFSSSDINAAGLGGITVTSARPIRVIDGLTLSPGGAVSLVAPTVDIAAGITVPAGNVTASTILSVGSGDIRTPLGGAGTGLVVLERGATIDTRGLWTNAKLDPAHVVGEAFVNGGSVTLDSAAGLRLASGSVIDTSSGAALLAAGKTLSGKGGNVTLIGDDPGVGIATAPVALFGTVTSYGVLGGGTLQLVAPAVVISKSATSRTPAVVSLGPQFFDQGFTTYDINGLSGVQVIDGTVLTPVAPVYRVTDASGGVPTGGDPASAMQLWLPPLYIQDPRQAKLTERQGVSLFLRSDANIGTNAARGGRVTLGSGAVIAVDPGGSVRLEGYDQVTVNGTIDAPSGTISVVNARTENFTTGLPPSFVPGLSVWLGPESVLRTAAQAVVALDTTGRPYGIVPSGGTVTLGSAGGQRSDGTVQSTDALVIVRPGAVVDASGTSAIIDPGAGSSGSLGAALLGGGRPVLVASAGGSISISSYDGIYVDGTLLAASGGVTAAGGTLSLTMEAPLYSSSAAPPTLWERTPRRILISQTTTSDLGTVPLFPGQATPLRVRDQARISVAQISAGGFDNVSLFARDAIAFDGDVSLSTAGSIRLYQGIIAETSAAAHVSISAPYVLLSGYTSVSTDGAVGGISINGTAWRPNSADTTAVLSIHSDLIDLVNDLRFGVQSAFATNGTSADGQPVTVPVALAGFSTIDLSSAGDIRFGTGTFVTPGSVSFSAAQLYPTTEANAKVYAGVQYYGEADANVYAPGNAITVTWNGVSAQAPYSVGGNLVLAAPTVDQGGILRAPEGNLVLGAVVGVPAGAPTGDTTFTSLVTLRPGSITSVSAAGQLIPFGGTSDGQTYTYNGASVTAFVPGIAIESQSVVAQQGATLDLSGGGELTGAGFQSGRGGSVDTLVSPLLTFGPSGVASQSLAKSPVYAIVPGYMAGYAPTSPLDQSSSYAGSVPSVGAQITIASGVPGLAAGTYTLLPSYFALLPGAFRVQLNTTTNTVLSGVTALPGGSFTVGGYRGTANTSVASALPVPVTLTPGSIVRTYSQYDEESYSQFQIAIAAQTGAPRAAIPADSKTLTLQYPDIAGKLPALTYAGVSKFGPAAGGFGSTVAVEGSSLASAQPSFEITGPGAETTPGYVALSATDLDALGAARLIIGGSAALASNGGAPTLTFTGQAASVVLRGGAVLSAPEVFLVSSAAGGASGAITVESGATIDTIGTGPPPYDSSAGYYYNSFGYSVLAASNGRLQFTPDTAASQFFGAITVDDGAALYAGGTLTFSTKQSLTLGAQATFGARYIGLDVGSVNILSDAVQATVTRQAAELASGSPVAGTLLTLPSGLQLSQTVLDRLLSGDPARGVPGVSELTLTATQSVNLFGGVTLNTSGGGLQQLVLNTPAIYGWSDSWVGGTNDVASISTGNGILVWNGIAASVAAGSQTVVGSGLPGGFASTGLGSGSGTLDINARQIVIGYPVGSQVNNQVSLARIIVGFADVNLTATQQIVGNNKGSLAVYQEPATVFGQSGTGGNLTLNTPLLTGQAGAVTSIAAGGSLALNAPGGVSPGAAGGLGAEIDISGQSVSLNSVVALPSGRFSVVAQSDITLGAAAAISVAGQSTAFFDQTRDGAGGTVTLQTATGDVTQAQGSTIDVSAGQASGGSLSIVATEGNVALAGTFLGSGRTAGSIDIRAGTLVDFAGLNQRLTQGGVTGSRTFELVHGDLIIGDELVASNIGVSLDDGNLTVAGTIDAAGAMPGTIDLSASGNLSLAAGSVLDAHATVLHTDSRGMAVDAENTPQVVLTSTNGTLGLEAGTTIDVGSADGVARGKVTLNAPRVGADDIAITASGPIAINGVWTGNGQPSGSVAVYGWRSYALEADPATGTALVTQSYLDAINGQDTQPFMTAVTANTNLQQRLLGLQTAAHGAFHLRPGVEIDSGASDGSMAIKGDINLANYRYGPSANEPGALVLRARGSLSVNGSVTDGFAASADSVTHPNPDDNGWVLFAGPEVFGGDVVLPVSLPGPISLAAGTTIPTNNAVALNYAITVQEATLNAGVVLPAAVTLAPAADTGINDYVIPVGGWVATGQISDANGAVLYRRGAIIPAGTTLQAGWVLGAGSVLPFQVNVPNGTVWPAGASLQAFNNGNLTLQDDVALSGGAFIPSGTIINYPDFSSQQNLRDASSGQQGQIWAIAPMLAPGSMSWSIGLVSGADTRAADRFTVRPTSELNGGGNMVLSDLHYTAPDQGLFGATPSFSVVRTGTGDLTLRSGGDIAQYSLFGIYTAGSQSASVSAAFELPQAGAGDGTVLGKQYRRTYDQYGVNYQAYYPTGGGNVLVAAQGGVYGDVYGSSSSSNPASDWVGNWLWRQGDGAEQPTAWWINFGNYVLPLGNSGGQLSSQPALVGFVGIGTLGGGNLTVVAGGDAGVTVGRDSTQRSQGLDLAVASTGRVTGVDSSGGVITGGTIVETGGGNLIVSIGGALNGLDQQPSYDGLNGTFTDLRGNLAVSARSIGRVVYQYGTIDPVDPRPLNPYTATVASEEGGVIVVPGDATVAVATRGDLVLGGVGDAGRLPTQDLPGFTYTGRDGAPTQAASGGLTSFSLWTGTTSVSLYSAGGNVTPTTQPTFGSLSSVVSNDMPTDSRFLYPANLEVVSASGSIYYGTTQPLGSSMAYSLELAPSPTGQMDFLARGSIYAAGYSVDMSGADADANALANPFRPEYNASTISHGRLVSQTNAYVGAAGPYALFAFGPDTPTSDLHAGDSQPVRFYAGADIVDFRSGEILNYSAGSGITPSTWYIAAKPTWIFAGQDIVGAGTRPALDASAVGASTFASYPNETSSANPSATTSGNLILNGGSNDVSVVSAGRDILTSYFYVAGPGSLNVQSGRNIDLMNEGIIKSIGPVFDINPLTRNGGAGISVLAGVGSNGLNVAGFAKLYLDPSNVANPAYALNAPQNEGKVAQSYATALLTWLKQNFDYSGNESGALAAFLALPAEQQQTFVRQVFFDELLASGREETDTTSPRYHSYLRGKLAIAALFPDASYNGNLTMFSGTLRDASGTVITDGATGLPEVFDAGISTQFGGDIQVLAPGGEILLGVGGNVAPGSNTGLVTFGSGSIETYSLGSVLLGQSRIFTTFGGSIQAWSAAGDINAGIGTKTSVVYQPPRITYDELGGLTLAPTAPTNGAGIATLSSISGVPAGDVDLVAPEGTIDAGEAGIRVSGNLTLAALSVVNSANLQVAGKTTGAPAVSLSNVGALNAGAAATAAAQNAASGNADDQRRKRQAGEASVISVDVLGFGE